MSEKSSKPQQRVDEDAGVGGTLGAGGGGSSHATSGGGNGAGTPDAETAMRAGQTVDRGDVEADRAKLFPEATSHDDAAPGAGGGD